MSSVELGAVAAPAAVVVGAAVIIPVAVTAGAVYGTKKLIDFAVEKGKIINVSRNIESLSKELGVENVNLDYLNESLRQRFHEEEAELNKKIETLNQQIDEWTREHNDLTGFEDFYAEQLEAFEEGIRFSEKTIRQEEQALEEKLNETQQKLKQNFTELTNRIAAYESGNEIRENKKRDIAEYSVSVAEEVLLRRKGILDEMQKYDAFNLELEQIKAKQARGEYDLVIGAAKELAGTIDYEILKNFDKLTRWRKLQDKAAFEFEQITRCLAGEEKQFEIMGTPVEYSLTMDDDLKDLQAKAEELIDRVQTYTWQDTRRLQDDENELSSIRREIELLRYASAREWAQNQTENIVSSKLEEGLKSCGFSRVSSPDSDTEILYQNDSGQELAVFNSPNECRVEKRYFDALPNDEVSERIKENVPIKFTCKD